MGDSLDLEVRRGVRIPAGELRESASRSRGPGGQHVNKASTRVTLRWKPGESDALSELQLLRLRRRLAARLTRSGDLVVHTDRFRSRARNRQLARERLAELVREGISVRRRRVATQRTAGSRQRARDSKQRRSRVKRTRGPVRSRDE